ncbi:hypothetical protein ACWDZ8_06495 [Streptomyces sp. NPDC003233]
MPLCHAFAAKGLEQLIALGARRMITVGTAASLRTTYASIMLEAGESVVTPA